VLAAERTLMAWLRNSLSMIGCGFTLVKLPQSFTETFSVISELIFDNTRNAEGMKL
jgi:uncharacterized membrane protein YidH (DUF202 family)